MNYKQLKDHIERIFKNDVLVIRDGKRKLTANNALAPVTVRYTQETGKIRIQQNGLDYLILPAKANSLNQLEMPTNVEWNTELFYLTLGLLKMYCDTGLKQRMIPSQSYVVVCRFPNAEGASVALCYDADMGYFFSTLYQDVVDYTWNKQSLSNFQKEFSCSFLDIFPLKAITKVNKNGFGVNLSGECDEQY